MLCCTGANREGVSSRKRREHALIADPLDGELPEAHPKSAQKLRQTGAVGGVLCLQTSGMPLASSGVPLMPHHTGTVRLTVHCPSGPREPQWQFPLLLPGSANADAARPKRIFQLAFLIVLVKSAFYQQSCHGSPVHKMVQSLL